MPCEFRLYLFITEYFFKGQIKIHEKVYRRCEENWNVILLRLRHSLILFFFFFPVSEVYIRFLINCTFYVPSIAYNFIVNERGSASTYLEYTDTAILLIIVQTLIGKIFAKNSLKSACEIVHRLFCFAHPSLSLKNFD